MLENEAGMEAVGFAMDVLSLMYWPTKSPFAWDDMVLCEALHAALPARGYTLDKVVAYRVGAQSFFTQLPDGRWAPNPEYFSMTNGNPGAQS